MKAFAYATAHAVDSALEMVRPKGRFLAGGIDLLGEMKEGLAEPDVLVNIKQLPGTREISSGADRWTIGANVTLATLAEHAELRRAFPGLAEACEDVGSPQMRNVATVGGNLAQHSRCWYYRQRDLRCLKKGAPRCLARGGENKYHSLFAKTRCLSPCVSNLAIALAALNASVVVQRGDKPVTMTIAELYQGAWENARVHHSLGAADLILRLEVPVVAGARSTYVQMGEKNDFDWALVSCAAAGRLDGGKLRGVRIALGCVAPVPWQVEAANAALEGQEPTEANALAAAELLLKDAEPLEHNGYKVPLAKALVKRAILKLAV
ncbi:FAD binding domain-containing protein [Opitutus terrae]|uniref:Molybdopterin dehydrogenase FAD-binding n=1 Tax=Opitutus terrae (strain DSM 11246 / JCM 15787 / PB90-1) TaxID=452637 RepID=B1ZT15_OPITP|nr:FAD binding domain-containing protein [Opitutus terrae]ACB75804.1 molybdopterin dehydrogenase FAD-binding [Opitutus terrae PB90-1]